MFFIPTSQRLLAFDPRLPPIGVDTACNENPLFWQKLSADSGFFVEMVLKQVLLIDFGSKTVAGRKKLPRCGDFSARRVLSRAQNVTIVRHKRVCFIGVAGGGSSRRLCGARLSPVLPNGRKTSSSFQFKSASTEMRAALYRLFLETEIERHERKRVASTQYQRLRPTVIGTSRIKRTLCLCQTPLKRQSTATL